MPHGLHLAAFFRRTALPAGDSWLTRLAFALLWLFVFAIPMENAFVLAGVGTFSRLMGMLALPFCLAAILERGRLRSLSPIHGLMAVFVFWVCLTYLWTAEPTRTLRTMGTCAQLLVMVWLLWELAVRRERQIALLKAFVWGATVSSIATLAADVASRSAHYQRPVAFGFDPNDLALTLALSVPMSLYLADVETRPLWRWLHRFQTVVATAAVIMTGSRGATLALLAGLMLIPLNFPRWNLRQRVGVSLTLLVALGSAVLLVPETSWSRLATTVAEVREGNLNQRTLIWQTGWDEFRKHPFLGVGASAFASTMERQMGRPEGGERVAHNAFLSVLFEGGVVGLSIYVSLLLAMVLVVFQMPRLERNFWLAALLAWGIGVCSLTWEYRKPTWFLFAMLTVQAATWVAGRQLPASQRLRLILQRSTPQWQWRAGFLSR